MDAHQVSRLDGTPGEALVDLLNTRPYAGQADRLADGRLRDLRDALMNVVETGEPWDEVNALIADQCFRLELHDGGARWTQVGGDAEVGAIARAVGELVADGAWSRLRLCARPECSGAFFDTTRSGTRRWHSYDTCGNRTNVEAHRARARAAN